MAKDEKKEEAKKLYIHENKSIQEISSIINVAQTTVYRWKNEDKEAGQDWDDKRAIWNLTPSELEKVYIECVKELVLKIKEDPQLMIDSKVADAMSKHIANLKKMNPKQMYFGAALDLLKVIDDYLKHKDKKLRGAMSLHFEGIRNALMNYIEKNQ